MSEIGYLQSKISELSDKVKDLENILIDLVNRLGKQKIELEDFFKVLVVKHKENIDNASSEIFEKNFKSHFEEKWKEVYSNLYFKINSIMEAQVESNEQWIKKLIEEVVLQRKDLGCIMSLMWSKGIINESELKEIDKKQIKYIEKNNIKDIVFKQLFPIIKKQKITKE